MPQLGTTHKHTHTHNSSVIHKKTTLQAFAITKRNEIIKNTAGEQ